MCRGAEGHDVDLIILDFFFLSLNNFCNSKYVSGPILSVHYGCLSSIQGSKVLESPSYLEKKPEIQET